MSDILKSITTARVGKIKLPTIKTPTLPKLELPKIKLDVPKVKMDLPKVKLELPKLEVPKVKIDLPKVNVPKAISNVLSTKPLISVQVQPKAKPIVPTARPSAPAATTGVSLNANASKGEAVAPLVETARTGAAVTAEEPVVPAKDAVNKRVIIGAAVVVVIIGVASAVVLKKRASQPRYRSWR